MDFLIHPSETIGTYAGEIFKLLHLAGSETFTDNWHMSSFCETKGGGGGGELWLLNL